MFVCILVIIWCVWMFCVLLLRVRLVICVRCFLWCCGLIWRFVWCWCFSCFLGRISCSVCILSYRRCWCFRIFCCGLFGVLFVWSLVSELCFW